tara:strand:+ start:242 stop:967 length:726 start_codon:yes stop_codon:yes gene_type:complete
LGDLLMKKFKSMKKRDEKMESLLMEKWGYSAPISNKDGDKELLQELVIAGMAVAGGWYTIAAIVAALGATGTAGYGLYDSHTVRSGAKELQDRFPESGIDTLGQEKLNPEALPTQVTTAEMDKLPGPNPVFMPGIGPEQSPELVQNDDGTLSPPLGFMWLNKDRLSGDDRVVPEPPEGSDDTSILMQQDRRQDPLQTDISHFPATKFDVGPDEEAQQESVTRTKEIVKEEIIKYFSNRRKS